MKESKGFVSTSLHYLNDKTSYVLFLFFLVFYALQIPFYTYKADVLAFVIRSNTSAPILDYAYLHSSTLLTGEALPNYHIGHTIIMWLAYQLVPQSYGFSLWPAGFVSAISGAFVILLTFLISLHVGLNKRKSIFIACSFGLLPTFWEHALIGEIHSLQMLFTLLFILSFLKNKIAFSTISFLIANLISPLSGLAFPLVFIAGINKNNFYRSIIVGSGALVMYIIVFYFLKADFNLLFNPISEHPSERGIFYRIIILCFFIMLNFGFFIFYIYKGINNLIIENIDFLKRLFFGSIPQLLLVFVSAGFFIEYGSFQLMLFWVLTFPLGIALSKIDLKSSYFVFALIFSMFLTNFLWINPHRDIGKSLEEAGVWLNKNGYKNVCLIGPWDVGLNILSSEDGQELEQLNKLFYDNPQPLNNELIVTNEKSLIIAKGKKIALRKLLSDLKIPGLVMDEYDPISSISIGKVTKLYENDAVSLFSWQK